MIIGNWKLNHLLPQTLEQLDVLKTALKASTAPVAIAPVVTVLAAACERVRGTSIQIAAQNVFYQSSGAFTGEWSVGHLKELGVSMVIVGHSERRQYFGETSESVALKAKACLDGGLIPVVCVGESLFEREAGQTELIIESQIKPVLENLSKSQIAKIKIAYEPIWAIGTGKNASPDEIQSVHAWLRKQTHPKSCLLYGGSVKPQNSKEILGLAHVDGLLVGGASLDAQSFVQIVHDYEAQR